MRYASIIKAFFLTAALSTAICRAAEATETPKPAIGETIRPFTFKDIRYLPRTLDELGDKQAYVLVFTTLHCPLVQRYLPVVKQLDEEFRDRGVQFLAVNVGAGDPLLEVAAQAVRVDAAFPFVKDFDGEVVQAVGASRTPEVVVLDAQRRLRYRGRIDSQFRLGGVRPTAGRQDLKEAIEEVLAGKEVSVPETPVDGCLIQLAEPPLPEKPPTFAEHVAPLLQQHCQRCHRKGRGPFPLISYDDALSHAPTIAEVVREGRMPPWYASREHGEFLNRNALSASQKRQILDWVRAGCPLGDESKLPAPLQFDDEQWRIGEPDLVLNALQTARLPATGVIPYHYVLLPYVFLADTWIQRAEVRPSNRQAVHHANMAYVSIGQRFSEANFITGYVPGGEPLRLGAGIGFKIPAYSMLAVQVHYVTTGEETTDRISVGLGFPRETIQKQLKHVRVADYKFAIPPNAPHYEVTAVRTLRCNASGLAMVPHMHLRGKDMTFLALLPDGTQETLLSVPNYSFEWQMPYVWAPGAKRFPKGTKIQCTAHFDNSAFNPYNPDPTKTVHVGEQTHDEMMMGFFFYTDEDEQLNLTIDPKTGRVVPEKN